MLSFFVAPIELVFGNDRHGTHSPDIAVVLVVVVVVDAKLTYGIQQSINNWFKLSAVLFKYFPQVFKYFTKYSSQTQYLNTI